jgi:NTE family protein
VAKLNKRKIGLALGGGAARGLAHIGVLEVLQKEGIPVDMIAGTSAGAAIGAIYAQGKDLRQIEELAVKLKWRRLFSLVDLALPKTGFIEGKKIMDLLQTIIGGDIEFSDLKIPLACVAADIHRCEEVVIKQGLVLEGVRASISIPAIFTIVKWQDRYLVDGSLMNPVPVSVIRDMGADFIIAVNVIPDRARQDNGIITEHKEPNIFNIIMQTTQIATCPLVRFSLEGADIIIEPQVAHIGVGELNRAQECILQGKLAAQDAIREIKQRL